MSELGDYLRQLRGNMSLREASERSNGRISHAAITQAEKGINSHGKPFTPSAETLNELAKLYDVSPSKLMAMAGYLDSQDKQPELVIADDSIKVYGEIHAGEASWAEQNIIGKIPVTKEMVMRYGRKNLFGLKIVGESMNRRLLPGYTAVFCKDQRPEAGDIVAVLIDHEDGTVKVYQETSLAVMFAPASYDPTFKPYVFRKDEPQDFQILGVYLFSTDQDI
ncbi:helix-turn-helix domain-containing protein [Lacticaseibacillus nasuensis]|uniref:XRE family transcriptional regulator n=1 Tax=Lacticaseibacillus nasuensis JCM 17158 TaxID=1291734 RepID=A0A0R1JY66_9LACO|nr:S24 family peptidase [Lacticaseibacillus nasuensis]KRK71879.1 XRE family transcriptional regulator [Lacticaseibacillus nasuensis JCM 17158]